MSKFTREYSRSEDKTAWIVYENYRGSRNGFPIASGEESNKIMAWYKAWKASR